jgi:serine/threonine-protein kinase HipA
VVANEHFCMSLAERMGLPVAPVRILRTPRPVLVVQRFDRCADIDAEGETIVQRRHIIDVCQAADMSRDAKYEHNFGSELPEIRDGVSFEVLFSLAELTHTKAATRQTFMRWALFQFLIGNCDAHGKNFSFFVSRTGIDPSPWYDLVNVQVYPGINHEIAMAFGDVFSFDELTPYALADFAVRCRVPRALLSREAATLARSAIAAADQQVDDVAYEGDERTFIVELAEFVKAQATRLANLAREAAKVSGKDL